MRNSLRVSACRTVAGNALIGRRRGRTRQTRHPPPPRRRRDKTPKSILTCNNRLQRDLADAAAVTVVVGDPKAVPRTVVRFPALITTAFEVVAAAAAAMMGTVGRGI